jgi:hypothetical protein
MTSVVMLALCVQELTLLLMLGAKMLIATATAFAKGASASVICLLLATIVQHRFVPAIVAMATVPRVVAAFARVVGWVWIAG